MNFTEQDRQFAINLINDLFEHDFANAINASEYEEETGVWHDFDWHCNCWKREHKELLDKWGVTIANGASKVCLILDDNYDWVIKMNIIDWEDDNDYCKLEADNYLAAVDAGLQMYFAEERLLTSIKYDEDEDPLNIYVQEYAESDYELIEEIFCKYAEEAYGDPCEEVYEDADRLEAVFDEPRLINFCFERHINDCHEYNYGRLENGEIVLIDYSGY